MATGAEPRRRAAVVLFVLNAAVWTAFGLLWLADSSTGLPDEIAGWIVPGLMAANAAAMLASAVGISRRSRLAYFFAFSLLVLNIALTLADQSGLLDFLTLLLDVALFVLLLSLRKAFPPPGETLPEGQS